MRTADRIRTIGVIVGLFGAMAAQAQTPDLLNLGWTSTNTLSQAQINTGVGYADATGANGLTYIITNDKTTSMWTLRTVDYFGNRSFVELLPVPSSVSFPRMMAIDSHYHVIVAGSINSLSYQNSNSAYDSIFLMALDGTGKQLWTKTIAGVPGGGSAPNKLFVDANENIYVSGDLSTSAPDAQGNYSNEMVLLKYDATGRQLYSKAYPQWGYNDGTFDQAGNYWAQMSLNGDRYNCAWGEFSGVTGSPLWHQQTNSVGTTYGYSVNITPATGSSYYLSTHIRQFDSNARYLRGTTRVALYNSGHTMQWLSPVLPINESYLKGDPAIGVFVVGDDFMKIDPQGNVLTLAANVHITNPIAVPNGLISVSGGIYEFADSGEQVYAYQPQDSLGSYTLLDPTQAPDGSFYAISSVQPGFSLYHFVVGTTIDSVTAPSSVSNTKNLTVTVNLSQPAPAGGAVVSIVAEAVNTSPFHTVVQPLVVPAGQTSASTTINTSSATSFTQLLVMARYKGALREANSNILAN